MAEWFFSEKGVNDKDRDPGNLANWRIRACSFLWARDGSRGTS